MVKKRKPAPKKLAPKKSKAKIPYAIHKGNENKTKSLEEIKEMLNGAPPTTYKPSITSFDMSFLDVPSSETKKDSETEKLLKELRMRVTALEHELENKLPNDHGYNYPIDITVLNVTDKTLENVPLFNDKYKDQQDVVYSSYFLDGYSDIIKFKNAIGVGSGDKEIGMIRVMSNSQMHSSAIIATSKSMDGVQTSVTLFMVIDPMQNQSCILQRNQRLRYNIGTNLLIKSLPPMTKFTYTIYFISEDYQKRMEELKVKNNSAPSIAPQP